MSGASERRDTPRKNTAIRIECLDGAPALVAHDISLGGMMVTSPMPRWPGEMAPVRFRLPGQKRAIRATVRVVDLIEVPHGVGLTLRFLKLAPQAQLAIHTYVDTRPLHDSDTDADDKTINRIAGWVARIIEDCKQLRALARS